MLAIDRGKKYNERKGCDDMKCPKCRSTAIYIDKDWGRIHARGRTSSWWLPLMQFILRNILWSMEREYGAQCQCESCGHKWFANKGELEYRHRMHLAEIMGEYPEMNFPAPDGAYLQLNEQGIFIHHSQRKVRAIPYDQITAVSFQENLGPLYGWLSVRHVGNSRKVFPRTFREAKKDRTTIFYPLNNRDKFYRIYSILKAIVEENRKAGIFKNTDKSIW